MKNRSITFDFEAQEALPQHIKDKMKKHREEAVAKLKTEDELADIATFHEDDDVANAAMRELRERFDPTYFFCADCDGLATTEKDCCLNRIENPGDDLSSEELMSGNKI